MLECWSGRDDCFFTYFLCEWVYIYRLFTLPTNLILGVTNAGCWCRIQSLQFMAKSFIPGKGCVRNSRMGSIRASTLARRVLQPASAWCSQPLPWAGSQITFLQRAEGGLFLSCKEWDGGDTTVGGSLPMCGRHWFCTLGLKDFSSIVPAFQESVIAMRLWMLGDEISSTCWSMKNRVRGTRFRRQKS